MNTTIYLFFKNYKINNHLNSLFKESRSNSLHQPNLWYDTIIFITELCKNQHLHLSPLTILNEHDGHNSKICSLTWDLVKRKKNYSTKIYHVIAASSYQKYTIPIVSILLVSFPNKTAAAAEDKLQKERIMLMMMIILHHLNSETPLFLKTNLQ
jgi:hypothetical protein